jgi:ABC-type transporter Mla subunit MlaD
MGTMDEQLSRAEIGKDAVQHTIEAAATTAGQVASIITGAVRDVAKVLGSFATEMFEIRDASRRAGRD